jgi:rubrerythrin
VSTSDLVAPELAAVEVHGMSRGAFVMRAALAAGAVYGGAAVGPVVREALAQGVTGEKPEGTGDLEVLNFALTLEFLEAKFYKQALEQVDGMRGEVRELATEILDNEDEHVAALTALIKQLKGRPVSAPSVEFGNAFASERSFLALAETFEDTGVRAYNGAGSRIESREVLKAAGGIAQIEGRHAALIRLIQGHEITPDGAIDGVLTMDEVNQAVSPYIL